MRLLHVSSVDVEGVLLLLKIAFLVLLYLFIWRIVRTASKDLRLPQESRPVVRALADRGILAGVSLGRLYPDGDGRENGLLVAVTEMVTAGEVEDCAAALEEVLA